MAELKHVWRTVRPNLKSPGEALRQADPNEIADAASVLACGIVGGLATVPLAVLDPNPITIFAAGVTPFAASGLGYGISRGRGTVGDVATVACSAACSMAQGEYDPLNLREVRVNLDDPVTKGMW